MIRPVLLNGEWTPSRGSHTFRAVNPATMEPMGDEYPVSPWSEVEHALKAASAAAAEMRGWPGDRFASFLESFAARIEARAAEFVEIAHHETALPVAPRLKDGELPRTVNQLRQAAAAAREGTWACPTIDTKNNIRSMFGPIGPVVVFGPNNFPFAFNSAAGGDFAAAIAAGNPVIAKGHSSHPGTTRLFAEEAASAASETAMPRGIVQLIYRTSHEDGCRLVSHHLTGAVGYTGARETGLVLKAAADKAGKPIYLELSSINPVLILPHALEERLNEIADQFTQSCLMGAGQFCTNPGLVVLLSGDRTDEFIGAVAERFKSAPVATMLSEGVARNFAAGLEKLTMAGAHIIAGGHPGGGKGFCHQNTLLLTDGESFLGKPAEMQTEAFGNGSLMVVARDQQQLTAILEQLEGNLTGCIYSDTKGADDELYDLTAPILRARVGRLLNDRMPTGVAVSPAMNHGGPFPATGHPVFTSVGIPASIHRFSMLQCYDNVRPHRLPPVLRDENRNCACWRLIDGQWTHAAVGCR